MNQFNRYKKGYIVNNDTKLRYSADRSGYKPGLSVGIGQLPKVSPLPKPSVVNKNKPIDNKRKVWIVKANVLRYDKNYIYVGFNNNLGICSWKQVSDYQSRLMSLIKINGVYSFLVLTQLNQKELVTIDVNVDDMRYTNVWLLSYKAVHPQEIVNKSKPIPTASHFITLNNIYRRVENYSDDYTTVNEYYDLISSVKGVVNRFMVKMYWNRKH